MDRSNVIPIQMHVTVVDLLRVRDGSADAKTIEHVTRHLAACERCAYFSREMFADEGPRALGAALHETETVALPGPQRRSSIQYLAIAAAALAIAAGAALVYLPSRVAPAPTPVKPVAARVHAPRPAGYERPEWDALVRDALASGKVIVAASAATPYADTLRGNGARAKLAGEMVPSATAVESPRPQLTWPAVAGAKYVVSIVAGDEVVVRSGTLAGHRWTPQRPLPRGRTYAWQVRVSVNDRVDTLPPPPLPNPQFRVIGDDAARGLGAARGQHPDDHLLLAVLAAKYGLRDEARNQLAQYAAAHPAAAPLRMEGSTNPP